LVIMRRLGSEGGRGVIWESTIVERLDAAIKYDSNPYFGNA
jgi:hypothetical protein